MARVIALFPCLFLGGVAAILEPSEPLRASPTRRLYLTVKDTRGEPVIGLTAEDLTLSENGIQTPILDLKESPLEVSANPAQLRRLFIVYFDEALSAREIFRARRWLLDAVSQIRPHDALAVYRSGRLSGFRSRRARVRNLIRYFGVNLFVGLPLGSSYFPSPHAVRPDFFTSETMRVLPASIEFGPLYADGAVGDLWTVLGALRDLPGHKVLIYVGAGLPRNDSPLYMDKDTAARQFADAGVALYVVPPGDPEDICPALQALIRATGGDLIRDTELLRPALARSLDQSASYYCASFRSSLPLDGQFRTIAVLARAPGLHISHAEGYFSTVAAAHAVIGKTFLTVLEDPNRYSDFPFSVAVKRLSEPHPGGTEHLEMKLTLPLERLGMRRTNQGSEGFLSQSLHMLVLALDENERTAGAWTRQYQIRYRPSPLGSAGPRHGQLEAMLDVDPHAIHALRVILISGFNRQISTILKKRKSRLERWEIG